MPWIICQNLPYDLNGICHDVSVTYYWYRLFTLSHLIKISGFRFKDSPSDSCINVPKENGGARRCHPYIETRQHDHWLSTACITTGLKTLLVFRHGYFRLNPLHLPCCISFLLLLRKGTVKVRFMWDVYLLYCSVFFILFIISV